MTSKSYVELRIKVVPGSSRTQIAGWLGDALKVKVSAPPERGKANQEVCQCLASLFKVSKKDIQIISGSTSAFKVLHINTEDTDKINRILNGFL